MDIRKFFSNPGAAKKDTGDKASEEPSAKKSKNAADKPAGAGTSTAPVTTTAGTAPAPARPSPHKPTPTKGKSPASAAKKKPATTPTTATKAKPKAKSSPSKPPAAKKTKKSTAVLNSDTESSDDDDDDNSKDEDFVVDLTGEDAGPSSSDDEDHGFEDNGSDDDHVMKDAKPAPTTGHKRQRKDDNDDDDKKTTARPSSAKKKPEIAKKSPATAKKSSKVPAAMVHIQTDPTALAAVAAVDAAAEKLPPEDDLGITFISSAGYQDRAPDEPPLAGQKEAPRGHPDCLTGKTFVVTGVQDSLTRPEAEEYIKRHGGKITSAVSGKTSFLVIGKFAGNSKYRVAKDKGIKMINEDGLFSLVAAAPEVQEQQQQQPVSAATLVAASKGKEPAAVPTAGFYSGSFKPSLATAGGAGTSKSTTTTTTTTTRTNNGQLWVEKWRPKTAAELIGNTSTVGLIRHWLKDWENVHLHGHEPRPPPGNIRKDVMASLKKKAVMLSGSPGIGKTSTAMIITKELGFTPIEVNASDARGKSDSSVLKGVGGKLANAIKELSTNTAVAYDEKGKKKRLCLIMDEVDGMSAGDRGGVADLIKTIHGSKIPIICICNDKYSPKLRSLRNHCLEADFRKPTVQQISKRMMDICAAEGLSINAATMDALIQAANGGDIRLVLGQLQMYRLRAQSLSYDQLKAGAGAAAKDLEMSPFEAARRLLDGEGSRLSLADQMDLVWQDFDLVPLLVQENYLNHKPRIATDDSVRLKVLAKAAEGFSSGDQLTRAVRQYQNWSLQPAAVAVGTVLPAAFSRGMRQTFDLYPGEQNFPRFTAWLGQNSSYGKQRRLLGELHTRMISSGTLSCDRTALRLDYIPVLKQMLTKPLRTMGKEGIEPVLTTMREYCLNREDIDYVVDVTKFKTKASWGEDPFKPVETAVKSAFTRAFNAQHLKPKTGFGMEEGKKKGKGRGRAATTTADEDEDPFGEEGMGTGAGGGDTVNGANEEEEEDLDPVMVKQKLMGLKHKGMELTLKDGSTAAKGAGGRGSRGGGKGSRGGGRAGGGRAGGGGRGAKK